MEKITLTIGIPAHNEEANIAHLLTDIAAQNKTDYTLTSVIVCSDGSTDKTEEIVRTFKDLPIHLIINRRRQGKAGVLNTIFTKSSSDSVVILDADVHINDPLFMQKLIMPIVKNEAHITGARVLELPPKGIFEALLKASMTWKRSLFESVKNGNNIYTCHGRGRAFSRKL